MVKRRVAIISPNPVAVAGGVERLNYYVKQALDKEDYEVIVYDKTRVKDWQFKFWNFIRMRGPALSYMLGKEFEKQKNEIDLVITNGMLGWYINFSPAISINHGAISSFAKAVKEEDSLLSYLKLRYIYSFFEKVSHRGKVVVSTGKSSAAELEQEYHIKSDYIIKVGVDVDHFKPLNSKLSLRKKFSFPVDKFLGIFVGRIDVSKGADIIEKVACLLDDEVKIVALVRNSGKFHTDKIITLRDFSYQELPLLYNACDFSIVTSRHEGFGLVFLESMGCGLPFIFSKVGYANEILEEEPEFREFILTNPEPVEIVYKINKLKRNVQLQYELGVKAREYVLKNNSLEVFKKKWLNLIKSLVADKR